MKRARVTSDPAIAGSGYSVQYTETQYEEDVAAARPPRRVKLSIANILKRDVKCKAPITRSGPRKSVPKVRAAPPAKAAIMPAPTARAPEPLYVECCNIDGITGNKSTLFIPYDTNKRVLEPLDALFKRLSRHYGTLKVHLSVHRMQKDAKCSWCTKYRLHLGTLYTRAEARVRIDTYRHNSGDTKHTILGSAVKMNRKKLRALCDLARSATDKDMTYIFDTLQKEGVEHLFKK